MTKVLTDPQNYTNIANAIRAKNGGSATYKPAQMAAAIAAIETDPEIESLTITANGVYTAPSGVDGYSPVTVNVPGGGGSGSVALADSIAIRPQFGEQYSFTASISSGLCIVEVLHRKNIIMSSGWTLLHTTAGDPEYDQFVSIYYREFVSAEISFTVSFEDGTTGLWPINIHTFSGSGTPVLYQTELATEGQHISLTKNTDNTVIWTRHEVYWWSSSTADTGWKVTGGWNANWLTSGNGRLCTVVDNTIGKEIDIYPYSGLANYYGEYFAIEIRGSGGTLTEISTASEMTAACISANEGKVYKFTGTTGTYVNSDLYIVEVNSGVTAFRHYGKNELVYKLPAEFQRVEYIESTGTQYFINMPFDWYDVSRGNTDIEIDVVMTASNTAILFGNKVAVSGIKEFQLVSISSRWRPDLCGTYSSYGSSTTRQIISIINRTLKLGTSYTGTVCNLPQSYAHSSLLCDWHQTDGTVSEKSSARLYSVKCSGNTNCNMIPCYRVADGEIGLYDVIGSIFYTNDGTGTFLKGSDVN